MRRLALALACVASFATLPAAAQSFNSTANRTADQTPVWEVHLHLQKTFASPLGQRVMEMLEQDEPEKYEKFVKFAEAIGIDPRTEIGEVVLFGDGFDEKDATIVASLGSSTGNLEGWILTAPGYRSEDLNENTQLYSMNIEDKNARAWFAIPKHQASGNYVLVGSLNQNRTVELAQAVLDGDGSPTPNPLAGSTIMSFLVNDFSAVPLKIDDNDPGSAIVKVIQRIGLNISSDDDNLSLTIDLSASSAGKARQISQLLTGLKALVQLAPIDEPEARKVADILDSMVVSHTEGQSDVQASLSAPYDLLEELLHEID